MTTVFLKQLLKYTNNTMQSITSNHDVVTTTDRLEAIIKGKGFNLAARVDHAGAAAKVGLELRPSQLLIFGNPKVGTLLMQAEQSVGLDLPLKFLVWQDEIGTTQISYDEPLRIKERRNVIGKDEVFEKVTNALSGMATAAAS